MMRSNGDASFLRSIPNGVLEEFRAEACLRFAFACPRSVNRVLPTQTGSFIKKETCLTQGLPKRERCENQGTKGG